MGAFSIWHWLIVLVVALLLFGGRGKISQIMGDFGKGLNAFKKNVKEETETESETKSISSDSPVDTESDSKKKQTVDS